MGTYTANTLLNSTKEFAGWRGPGYANAAGLTYVRAIPFRQMKTLVFEWSVKPSPLKRNKDGSLPKNAYKPSDYTVYVEFRNVLYADEPQKADDSWDTIAYNGITFYYEKPRIDRNPVNVDCSCPDYEFRFAEANYKAGCKYGGRYKKYSRKTPAPPQGRPFANPNKTPGMCKHVYACITRMLTEGWIL